MQTNEMRTYATVTQNINKRESQTGIQQYINIITIPNNLKQWRQNIKPSLSGSK